MVEVAVGVAVVNVCADETLLVAQQDHNLEIKTLTVAYRKWSCTGRDWDSQASFSSA